MYHGAHSYTLALYSEVVALLSDFKECAFSISWLGSWLGPTTNLSW